MKDLTNGAYDRLEASLTKMPQQIGMTPTAVLVISGHWQERDFTVMSSAHPPMIYDYSGFPEHTYRIKYAAPGSPETAERVRGLIEGAGFPAHVDAARGYDHGTFAPLAVIYPDADVPVLQLPLMVVVGAAGNDKAVRVYHEDNFFGGIAVSSFMFGAA
jgi:aromatic ring-opening dioxygenase catalytic subunit (LigB family)